jgi:hypothetical protein
MNAMEKLYKNPLASVVGYWVLNYVLMGEVQTNQIMYRYPIYQQDFMILIFN